MEPTLQELRSNCKQPVYIMYMPSLPPFAAFCAHAPLRQSRALAVPDRTERQPYSRPAPTPAQRSRATPRCGSLEDSKKRARSPYDNIPDINQQYMRELRRVETAFGPGKLPPSPTGVPSAAGAAGRSILRPPGVRAAALARAKEAKQRFDDAGAIEAERLRTIESYDKLRFTLLSDTVFIGMLAVCAGWAAGDVATAASVGLGAAGSVVYVLLLSRGVDNFTGGGDALAPARIAVLALLVVGAARRRDFFQVVPVMLGFFSYKAATILPLITGEAFEDL
jgi:hypothetical protein